MKASYHRTRTAACWRSGYHLDTGSPRIFCMHLIPSSSMIFEEFSVAGGSIAEGIMDALELLMQWLKDNRYNFSYRTETPADREISNIDFLVVFNPDEQQNHREWREVALQFDESGQVSTFRGMNCYVTRCRKDLNLGDPRFFDQLSEVLDYLA